jgi:hypothetical protein
VEPEQIGLEDLPPKIRQRVNQTLVTDPEFFYVSRYASPFGDEATTYTVDAIQNGRYISLSFGELSDERLRENSEARLLTEILAIEVKENVAGIERSMATIKVRDMEGEFSTGVPVRVARALMRARPLSVANASANN